MAEFIVEFRAQGISETRDRLDALALSLRDSRKALAVMSEIIFDIEAHIFSSEGEQGAHGKWEEDTDAWLQAKMMHGLDPRIGHATHTLRNAVTRADSPHQHIEITPHEILIGVDLPYAETEQRHRPFVDFTEADAQEMAEVLKTYFEGVWDLSV